MSDVIMSNYNVETHLRLQSITIDSIALSLATKILLELEESLVNDRDYNVITTISVLRACMVSFGQMYGLQDLVAAYLTKHDEATTALGT
jgi:hypothetical protein